MIMMTDYCIFMGGNKGMDQVSQHQQLMAKSEGPLKKVCKSRLPTTKVTSARQVSHKSKFVQNSLETSFSSSFNFCQQEFLTSSCGPCHWPFDNKDIKLEATRSAVNFYEIFTLTHVLCCSVLSLTSVLAKFCCHFAPQGFAPNERGSSWT